MRMRKRHSPQEIASKLLEADELVHLGKGQAEIARSLGISVMTYHRWRAARASEQAPPIIPDLETSYESSQPTNRVHGLQVENDRLRQLVIDLLLGKMSLTKV
jgi:putative transposase